MLCADLSDLFDRSAGIAEISSPERLIRDISHRLEAINLQVPLPHLCGAPVRTVESPNQQFLACCKLATPPERERQADGSLAKKVIKTTPVVDLDQDHPPSLESLLITRDNDPRNGLLSSNSYLDDVPTEIWGQIFYLCLPDDDFVQPNPCEAPLLLGQICQSWRNIALNTPKLWSCLSICSAWQRPIWKTPLEWWLTRTGNALLDLEISIPASLDIPIYTEPCSNHIFSIIASSASRWRRLRLNLSDYLLRSMLDNQMPELQVLELNSRHTFSVTSLYIKRTQAPQLRNVTLLSKQLYPRILSLPWEQLTQISTQCWLNVKQHLDVLRQCPKLETYHMFLVHRTPSQDAILQDPHDDSPALLLRSLVSLEIVVFIGTAVGPMLSRLEIPALSRMKFRIPLESPTCRIARWPKIHIVSLIERSSCSLLELSFEGIQISQEELEEAKELIPTLINVEKF